jgi:iron complex outermembrane recepter protein
MNRGRRVSLRSALIGSVALLGLDAGIAQAQETNFAIPAQALDQTLRQISRITGENILFRPESVSGLRAPALIGKMSAQNALSHALSGSDLQAVPDGSGGVIIQKRPRSELATPADQASETGPPGEETVVVTGSRIPQTGVASASPVVVIGRQEIEFEGTTDVTTLINNLPEAFVAQNANVSNGATGTDNVNLRDLGPSRTLVLVDGSRLMPGDPLDPVADINVIPAALVDRVEVETGGASAVYGSDALAGVVNFVLRRNFEGLEVDGTYSITQNDNDTGRWRDLTQTQIDLGSLGYAQSPLDVWNGQTEDVTLLMGVNSPDDKGNISLYLGYRSMSAVLQQSRDYSECAIATTGQQDFCFGSDEFNHWLSFDNLYAGEPFNFFQTGTGKRPSGAFVPFTGAPDQIYNFNPSNYFQRPDTRYTGGFFAHYDVSTKLEVFANFMFTDDSTVAQIAPSGLFFGSGTGPSFTVYTNCSNPYMTAAENKDLCGLINPGAQGGDQYVSTTLPNGQKFSFWNGADNAAADSGNPNGIAGQANLYIARRDVEGGERQFALRHSSYRMQIGARGDLGDGWSYNVYAQEGFANFAQSTTGEFSASHVQNALEVDPATRKCYAAEQTGGLSSTAPDCVPLDIFNGIGSIDPAMLKYVNVAALETGWTQEQIVSGSLTGNLGDWGIKSPWAKNAAVAVLGSEYRQEDLTFLPDNEYLTGDIEGSLPIPAVPTSGFNVKEGFVELQLPIIQGLPFIEDATLKGGYRYSSYSEAGPTNTWYGAAQWQPVDDFGFRASMQRAVRAPNVLELFTPQTIGPFFTNYPGTDPCATITTGECAKVRNAGSAILFCPASSCNEQFGGNAYLKPEISETRSAGIVLTPTFLDGFSATIDWWNIDVAKYISQLPAAEIVGDCYGPGATPEGEAFFCPFVHRSPNGTLYGGGYVSVDSINTGYLKTSGVDFQLNYQTDTADWLGADEGKISVNLIGTWLDTLNTEGVPITPLTAQIASQSAYDCAGLYGLTCGTPAPRWRSKLRLTWTSPFDVTFSIQWRYIGATALDADTSNQLLGGGPGLTECAGGHFSVAGEGDCSDARISSYNYFDLSTAWQVRSGVELRAGVNNIFDVEPPVISESAQPVYSNGNTITGLYDVLGRTIFVAATIKY